MATIFKKKSQVTQIAYITQKKMNILQAADFIYKNVAAIFRKKFENKVI